VEVIKRTRTARRILPTCPKIIPAVDYKRKEEAVVMEARVMLGGEKSAGCFVELGEVKCVECVQAKLYAQPMGGVRARPLSKERAGSTSSEGRKAFMGI
jgi:hypothetical protein